MQFVPLIILSTTYFFYNFNTNINNNATNATGVSAISVQTILITDMYNIIPIYANMYNTLSINFAIM